MAAKALRADFFVAPQHFANALDTPSPAAIALAQSLTFPSATTVEVCEDNWEPEDDAEQPDAIVIDSMPHNAFPTASRLSIYSSKVRASGRRLLTKMPAVKRIDFRESTEEQAVGVLQAVGGERELECFEAWWVTGVGEGGLTWGDMAEQLPTIERLDVRVEVPDDLGDGDAAGEFGIACVKRLVEERTHGDTIEGLEGRYDIEWGWKYSRQQLILKRLDT
ncbi:unnamed protein product [Vitrella brassicaformis CCMP3155]|uniref:Uncharacterized protein n=1 Tax=Vitrella brassicaformis (strain CCMP3155) TaxID=1169540 RepID=A0A0G4GE17_VITBC|nr:unnamed protein product [Vitrella brassicaformis CCMP3155]|eukprot:CEM27233.1 unnamed protein product [Vitrella brassicaformis CCMP3155]